MQIYQERIKAHTLELDGLISKNALNGHALDFKNMAYWFSFDVMGLFVFNRSFSLISSVESRFVLDKLREAFSIVSPISPVPWLAQIGFTFLRGWWVVASWHWMIKWCQDRIMERVEEHDETASDVSARLVNDYNRKERTSHDTHLLCGDSIAAIVAGSDTVGSAMCFLFYELARHPHHQEKIWKELRTVKNIYDVGTVQKLPHLSACINETLRYHHVIPTGGYRDTPDEGLMVSETFIPGNTTVIAPRYILSRLESAFELPNQWIPERWTEERGLVRDERAHVPFSLGRYACPGRMLALSELSFVTAILISKYTFRFPGLDDGGRVERDMIDQFTALPGQLDLVFQRRPKS
ncbi:MAG: hypothetical protein Q9162_005984 [Coniocarpon cinnabarinum]